jgi:hypothetical protein
MLTGNPKSKDMAIPWEEDIQMFIYKIINDIDDKTCVGKTTDAETIRESGIQCNTLINLKNELCDKCLNL